MGPEELLALLVRLVGTSLASQMLQRLVADAGAGGRVLRGCYRPFVTEPYDADELGIYDDELEGECRD
jgi:hypothetical protein